MPNYVDTRKSALSEADPSNRAFGCDFLAGFMITRAKSSFTLAVATAVCLWYALQRRHSREPKRPQVESN